MQEQESSCTGYVLRGLRFAGRMLHLRPPIESPPPSWNLRGEASRHPVAFLSSVAAAMVSRLPFASATAAAEFNDSPASSGLHLGTRSWKPVCEHEVSMEIARFCREWANIAYWAPGGRLALQSAGKTPAEPAVTTASACN
ncbi:hypothetical protein Dda_1499 [Drechslerella dactyloides]|uniref:Uncharacterized protein n=1 Tax=Drechslerella dactyloides TaxID=74499 RepID=A0AAD6J2J8_DREDA|nr:hypothetical protein Dda_1499 [Drechslerella dactyloides]